MPISPSYYQVPHCNSLPRSLSVACGAHATGLRHPIRAHEGQVLTAPWRLSLFYYAIHKHERALGVQFG
jgi:hypothetical protein